MIAKSSMIAGFATVFLVACADPPLPPPEASNQQIVYDGSGSFAGATSVEYAAAAARFASSHVREATLGDTISIAIIGDGTAATTILARFPTDRSLRLTEAAERVSATINAIPSREDHMDYSRLHFSFEEVIEPCVGPSASVIIFTDGLDSELGDDPLPPPEPDAFAGCTVKIVGLGRLTQEDGKPPSALSADEQADLEARWIEWFTQGGATSVDIVRAL